ncbi:protein Skeletor, isoforms B/C-like [Eriocheir sinensis]|uniref:protein Skeletor, isoforms B/C-like n=1 Tax=Eriocheir sinensis TaxID=95602 RepID=UPI0021C7CCBD|nr:protein Skeletor, isoforms B/C-like [Eriocheir sinensis]
MKARGLLSLLGVLGVAALVSARSSSSSGRAISEPYKGTYIGKLSTLEHKVTGHVYALDNITIYIEGFTYDGEAPDAFFFAGNNSPRPTSRGFIIPDEQGRTQVLGPYQNRNIVLKFPVTKKGQRSLNDVKWVSVWCRKFAIDFGHILIPKGKVWPARQVATGLRSDKPLVSSSSVTLMDTNTIQLKDFTFDGTVQDAIFVMGSGDASSSGTQVPNERSASSPLPKYTRKTIELVIPAELRGQPVQYFGVWSPTKGMLASVTFDPDALLPPPVSDLV